MGEAKARILVVDDEERIRRGLRAWLEDEDFEVVTAESGEAALDILTRHPADGAIVDIRLPGMDGNAFMEHAHRLFPQMRFLVYTGSVDYVRPENLKGLGIDQNDVFYKPLRNMDVLVSAVRERIKR